MSAKRNLKKNYIAFRGYNKHNIFKTVKILHRSQKLIPFTLAKKTASICACNQSLCAFGEIVILSHLAKKLRSPSRSGTKTRWGKKYMKNYITGEWLIWRVVHSLRKMGFCVKSCHKNFCSFFCSHIATKSTQRWWQKGNDERLFLLKIISEIKPVFCYSYYIWKNRKFDPKKGFLLYTKFYFCCATKSAEKITLLQLTNRQKQALQRFARYKSDDFFLALQYCLKKKL